MAIDIPASDSTVSVQIIDNGKFIGLPVSMFAGPDLEGFEGLTGAIWNFLITHQDRKTGAEQRIIFDLGLPKDWQNDLPPSQSQQLAGAAQFGARVEVPKYLSEILTEGGVDLNSINAMIMSHLHLDHSGKPSLFPNEVELIIGPGAKKAFGPGFPHNQDSPIMARELEGRKVTEPDFDASSLTIGGLRAIDYFGDGSFYILDTPGHMIGHLNALVRTTPDTFIYLGADSCHHMSVLRPNEHTKLPKSIDIGPASNVFACPCPGELFHQIHPSHASRKPEAQPDYAASINKGHPDSTPAFTLSKYPDGSSLAHDYDAAIDVIEKLKAFDADDRIFTVIAHDNSLDGVIDLFPKSADDWKEKGWKEQGRWKFLRDFEKAVEISKSKSG